MSFYSCQPNKANDSGGVCVPIEARLTYLESDSDHVTHGYSEQNLNLLKVSMLLLQVLIKIA